MSFFPAKDPVFGDARSTDAIVQIILPRSVHLAALHVQSPSQSEETAAGFACAPSPDTPQLGGDGLARRAVAGSIQGLRAPGAPLWEAIFAEGRLGAGTVLPLGTEYEERALYVISGEIE